MEPSRPATPSSKVTNVPLAPLRTPWRDCEPCPLDFEPKAAMTILDVCAYLGLAAVGTATVNMLLGLLIALRYSPVRLWPHRRMNIFRLHNLTACLVLLLIVLHPAVLLLKSSTHFGWGDVLLPIHSPVQPRLNTVGAVSLYVLLVVIFTSLLRRHIARPLWRKLHYLVFPAFALMFFHSVLTDPTLSKRES
jgi:predicted ferric reductase